LHDPEPPDGYAPKDLVGFEDLIGPLYARTGAEGEPIQGFRVQPHHVNGRGACHGGMLVAFADLAWGKRLAAYGFDAGWATVRLTTDFLAPAPLGAWVEASSTVVGRDGDLFTLRGDIRAGELVVMTGSAIYKGMWKKPGN
jgi:acyl-coenzyme A thioesterase PaaI-like protein